LIKNNREKKEEREEEDNTNMKEKFVQKLSQNGCTNIISLEKNQVKSTSEKIHSLIYHNFKNYKPKSIHQFFFDSYFITNGVSIHLLYLQYMIVSYYQNYLTIHT